MCDTTKANTKLFKFSGKNRYFVSFNILIYHAIIVRSIITHGELAAVYLVEWLLATAILWWEDSVVFYYKILSAHWIIG